MTRDEIARALANLGCPPGQCAQLASQLERRARMDAGRQGIAYEASLQHLLGLMAQGWVAQGKRQPPGIQEPH